MASVALLHIGLLHIIPAREFHLTQTQLTQAIASGQSTPVASPFRAWYLAAALAAFAAMVAAILGESLWFLDFVHVMAGSLWTGIDLFMGFVIGPVLRRVSLDTRRAMIAGIIPRTLILMPALSTITSTAGWFLALRLGFLDVAYPQFWWVIAALAIVTVLTVQGLGYLLPMNLKLYFEISKDAPDPDKLKRWMRTYVRVVAVQGTMQVLIIVVMARFATGF
jgi:hypothetical protein